MKMFLTRLGFGSKIVVTGDVTQVDLPGGTEVGLRRSSATSCDGVEDIHFSRLTSHRRRPPPAGRATSSTPTSGTSPCAHAPATVRPRNGRTARPHVPQETSPMSIDVNNESGWRSTSEAVADSPATPWTACASTRWPSSR